MLTSINKAFVIGGGPSLKGFDFSRLAGRPCYAANKAAFDVPWGNLVSIDRDFASNFTAAIASFGRRAHLAGPNNIRDLNPHAHHYTRTRGRSVFDFAPESDELPGLNSGFAALALAIRDGHRDIALLGIDMKPNQGHYHGGYSWNPGALDGVIRAWVEDFDKAGKECADMGINVVNYSMDSAVTGFVKRPLETLFCDILKEKEVPHDMEL